MRPLPSLLAAVLFVFLLGTVSAQQSFLWTSSAELSTPNTPVTTFNREVETTVESGSVPGGAFRLTDRFGDAFAIDRSLTGGTGVAFSFKWNIGGSCDGDSQGSRTVVGGRLRHVTGPEGTSAGRVGNGNSATFSGDLDIEVQMAVPTEPSGLGWFIAFGALDGNVASMCGVTLTGPSGIPTNEGALIYLVGEVGGTYAFRARRSNLNVLSTCGSDATGLSGALYIRITRTTSTDTWTFYRGVSSPASTLHASCTQTIDGNLNVGFVTVATVGASKTAWFADFLIRTATAQAVVFRTSGSWVSENFTVPVGEEILNMTIDHSNLNASRYIDRIVLERDDGSTVEAFETNIASGSRTNLNLTETVGGGDYRVRIVLVGEATSSPVVSQVEVATILTETWNIFIIAAFIVVMTTIVVGSWQIGGMRRRR